MEIFLSGAVRKTFRFFFLLERESVERLFLPLFTGPSKSICRSEKWKRAEVSEYILSLIQLIISRRAIFSLWMCPRLLPQVLNLLYRVQEVLLSLVRAFTHSSPPAQEVKVLEEENQREEGKILHI